MTYCENCGAILNSETSVCERCEKYLNAVAIEETKKENKLTIYRFSLYAILLSAALSYFIYTTTSNNENSWSIVIYTWLILFAHWAKNGVNASNMQIDRKALFIIFGVITAIILLIKYDDIIKEYFKNETVLAFIYCFIGGIWWHAIYSAWLQYKSNK